MFEILSAALGFGAVIIGVRGNTWNDSKRGLGGMTAVGWLAILLGTLSLAAAIWKSNFEHHAELAAASKRAAILRVAVGELNESVEPMAEELTLLADNAAWRSENYVQPPRNQPDNDRLRSDRQYRAKVFHDASFESYCQSTALSDVARVHSTGEKEPWWHRLGDRSVRCTHGLNEAIGKYSESLDPRTILLAHAVATDFYLRKIGPDLLAYDQGALDHDWSASLHAIVELEPIGPDAFYQMLDRVLDLQAHVDSLRRAPTTKRH